MTLRRRAALFALGWLCGGCFNPNLTPGAFTCFDGHICPGNFHCASDGRCYPPDAGPDVLKVTCTSPTPAPLCSRATASGLACNPACQDGCSCGWCGIDFTSGAVTCLEGTPGTKTVGTICDPSISSDCAPGLTCRAECGSSGLGRCYKFCDTSADCGTGSTCSASVASGTAHLCSLVDPQCDPIKQTGCPSGFACYPPTGSTTVCDCIGTGGSGVTCKYLTDCMPGYWCVRLSQSSTDATCQKLCRTSADCGTGTCSLNMMTYGYCTP